MTSERALRPYRKLDGSPFQILPGRSLITRAKPVLKAGGVFTLGVVATAMAVAFIGAYAS